MLSRRAWLGAAGGSAAMWFASHGGAKAADADAKHLTITNLRITPIALPDPPILAAGGCHGPYFLRNVIEIETDGGVIGIGETHGGEATTRALNRCRRTGNPTVISVCRCRERNP